MNRDILTVWQDTKSPGTVLIGPGLLLLFVDYFLFFFHVKLILVGIKGICIQERRDFDWE